jgi:hypothetical protein
MAPRWRRWVVKPLALAALTLSLGLGGGTAWAYFSATGSGTGHAKTGSPVALTITATSGAADLLPGGTGAAYFTVTNPNPFGATFTQVATGATVVSNNTSACPSANVSIAPTLPHTFSPAVTVAANSTSGTKSITNLVALASAAPSACQNVTFTVTLTLQGKST